MRLRHLATAVVATALLLSSAGPAAAIPSPYAIDDVVGVPIPKGNITSLRVVTSATQLTVNLTFARGFDIQSAIEWGKDTGSELRLAMDTGGTAAAERKLRIYGTDMGLSAEVVETGAFTPQCTATVTQPGGPTTVRIRIPRGCLAGPDHVRLRVVYEFDQLGDGDVDSVDRAPDAGPTPRIDFP